MPSLPKQLENWLKPLRLEEKQGFSNKSVVQGLDRYLMRQCDELLRQGGIESPQGREFTAFLKELRRSFSQYMTYSPQEREELVAASQTRLKDCVPPLPEEPAPANTPIEKHS